jgi:2'-5' RNA ligase
MRTFIALKIKPEKQLLTVYSALIKSLELEAVSWVNPENLHLTLRFLGETSIQQVEEIMHSFDELAQRFHPFQFSLKDVGFFKSKNQPRILFFAIENCLMLNQLAAEIEERIVALGFSREERFFNPHLTIGRIKFIQNIDGFYSLIKKFSEVKIQQVTVSEIIFYQSILSSEGTTYRPVKIINLID